MVSMSKLLCVCHSVPVRGPLFTQQIDGSLARCWNTEPSGVCVGAISAVFTLLSGVSVTPLQSFHGLVLWRLCDRLAVVSSKLPILIHRVAADGPHSVLKLCLKL